MREIITEKDGNGEIKHTTQHHSAPMKMFLLIAHLFARYRCSLSFPLSRSLALSLKNTIQPSFVES